MFKAGVSGWMVRPPRQFVTVRNFEPRLFVPMPGNMGRPAFTFINLYIFCNLQHIIKKNIHLGYVCIYFLICNSFICLLALLSTLLKYAKNTEYTENLTESEKRKLRKQAKHYVSKDNLLY